MGRFGTVLKYLLLMALVGLIGLAGFSLVSDLPAPVREVTVPLDPPGTEP